MNKKIVYVNTCVFGTKKMNLLPDYIEKYKGQIGFEVLSMFDLPDFEQKLEKYLPVLQACPISFHGPVFCVEHSAPKGSKEYDESMFHIRKTLKYAKALKSTHLTMHLNNCVVDPEAKERMLCNALDNHRELQALFGDFGCQIFVENTGINYKKNVLLNQDEFTELCIKKHFDVLVDVGHASANQWDIPKLITNLKDQIKAYHLHNNDGIHDNHNRLHDGVIDMDSLIKTIKKSTPEAELIIEYTNTDNEGTGLRADIEELLSIQEMTR